MKILTTFIIVLLCLQVESPKQGTPEKPSKPILEFLIVAENGRSDKDILAAAKTQAKNKLHHSTAR